MTILLLLAVVALGFALRGQARRIAALEEALRADLPVPAAARAPAPAARVILPADGERAVAEPAPPPAAPLATHGEAEVRREEAVAASPGTTFEQLVGGKLPIWVGGAALAIAGFFLVRLAIESGLLTPAVRVALASLFGIVLLVASEAAARATDDARVGQSLAGAGIATLYAAAYLAGSHYGLIGPVAAFAMMAAVTALALGLAFRRGAPAALMGLVGGFATPLLAGAQSGAIVPLLVYLGLLSAGLLGLAVARGWLWLALGAAAGSLVWSGLLIATTAATDALAVGGFVLVLALAAALATAASGAARSAGRAAALPLVAGAAQLALLVAATRFGAGAWGLYLLLAAATIVLAWRDARLVPAVAAALGLAGVALAGGVAAAPLPVTIAAAAGITLLFGGSGHALARRAGDGRWWAAIGAAGLALPYIVLGIARAGLMPASGWSAVAALLALPPLHLAFRSRLAARGSAPFDAALAIGAGTAAAFAATALAVPLPAVLAPVAILAVAMALAAGGRRIGDGGVQRLALAAVALAALTMLAMSGPLLAGLGRALAGEGVLLPLLPNPADAIRLYLVPAVLIAAVATRARVPNARPVLIALTATAAAAGAWLLWKQLFAIRSASAFVALGFAERAILTQALFAAGLAARVRGWRIWARALTAAAVARILWFDLGVCNPAFVDQAVGRLPIANLVTLHFAAALAWIERAWRAEPPGKLRGAALAALVAVAAGGTLLIVRQAFHAPLLTAGAVSRPEFYGYSAAGVVLAAALSGWGARVGDRGLRVAGLGLLTIMVLKVFLVDAAALSGLLRIASFLGLGVTLIGIGWAYGRFLGRDPPVRA